MCAAELAAVLRRPGPRAPRALACLLALGLGALAGGCGAPCVGVLEPPPPVAAYNDRGVRALQQGQLDEAIKNLELALKLEPAYIKALANLGYAYHLKGQYDNAIIHLRLAIENCPDYCDSYNFLGLVYWQGMRDFARAEEQFKLAIDTCPTYDEPLFNLGEMNRAQGKQAEALKWYLAAARVNPKHLKANVQAGMIYLQNGYDKDAEQHFQLALDLDEADPLARYGIGRLELKKERWVEGIDHLRRALEADPHFEAAKKLLAWAYQKAPDRIAAEFVKRAHAELDKPKDRDLDRALDDLESARRIDPELIDADILQARVYLDKKDLANAEKWARRAYTKDPRNHDVRYLAAVIHMFKGDFARAAAHLRKLALERPRELKYRNNLGVCYFKLKEYRKAEREWRAALELPGSEAQKEQVQKNLEELLRLPHIRRANELNELGWQLVQQHNLEGAESYFRQAIALDDAFAVAHARLAIVALERNDLALARRKAEDALARDPDLPLAHLVRGRVWLREDRLAEAKAAFEKAEELAPQYADAMYWQGVVAEQARRPDVAKKLLEKAVVTDPKHAAAHLLLARIYRREGNHTKAEDHLHLAITAQGESPAAYVELGRLHLARGEHAEAEKAFEAAHQLDPSAPEPWEGFAEARQARGDKELAAQAYATAAELYLARQDARSAEALARRAALLAPERAAPLVMLGYAQEQLGKPTEALATLRRATELEGGQNLRAWFELGLFYQRRGELQQAAHAYRRVLELNPDNYFAMENLADLYREGLEQPVSRQEAIELLKKALQLDPRPDKKEALREVLRRLMGS
ncbi:MAG: hypothetical protein KatS3mg102_1534 [Planctomycetota bacterium]|nr:MAG: hypothetical protein KatS3mg102_1534 [Planctomycetota bacterium]